MNMDKLNKFSEVNIDVKGPLGWWCHIPKVGRGESPELRLTKPRSRSSSFLRSKMRSPERFPFTMPRPEVPKVPEFGSLDQIRHAALQLELSVRNSPCGEAQAPTAQFTRRPPAEPLVMLTKSFSKLLDKERDKAAWSYCEEDDAGLCDEVVWLTPRLARPSRPRAQRVRPSRARHPALREAVGGGAAGAGADGTRRVVRGLLRGLLATLPIRSQTALHEIEKGKKNIGSCDASISVQVLEPHAPVTSRSVSVQAKSDISHSDVTVSSHCDIMTGDGERARAGSKDEWVGSVRALRDSHVRLVLRQLRHIERLNRALDHVPKH